MKLYRHSGNAGFYAPTVVRGPAVMTLEAMEKCRRLLAEGRPRSEVPAAAGINKCSLDKAIQKKLLPPSARPARSSRASTRFEECLDVERGGVLCALPALAAKGLFDHLAPLDAPREGGFYYRLLHVFSLLALMALLVSLNEAEFKYPGTDLRMVYQMLTPANPPGG